MSEGLGTNTHTHTRTNTCKVKEREDTQPQKKNPKLAYGIRAVAKKKKGNIKSATRKVKREPESTSHTDEGQE